MDINNLIKQNKGLVYKQLHKFNLVHDPEAESIAYEALYNAIQNYDSSNGTALSTLATVYIYNALGSYVRKLNKQRQIQTISYNNIAYNDDADAHEYNEWFSSDTDVEKDYMRKEVGRLALEEFNRQYDMLTNDKHKAIIKAWLDSEFSAQTTDIAGELGVSQSYVSQIINNFKSRLKKRLEDVYYD